jgi:predicted  nucleic acid-binding Zn-ribbon protein
MSIVGQLYLLQTIDLELQRQGSQLERLRAGLGESPELAAGRAELLEAERLLSRRQSQERDLEWDLKNLEDKIKALEDKLYGGRIGNPKELAGLAQEVEMLKRSKSKVEDSILSCMLEIDEQRLACNNRKMELEGRERAWAASSLLLKAQVEELEATMAGLRGQRTAVAGGLDEEIMALYEELRQAKGGRVVVRLEHDVCAGCHLGLPSADVQHVRASAGPVRCRHCGRILYAGP